MRDAPEQKRYDRKCDAPDDYAVDRRIIRALKDELREFVRRGVRLNLSVVHFLSKKRYSF